MRPNRSKDLENIMSKLEGHLQQSMKGPSHSNSQTTSGTRPGTSGHSSSISSNSTNASLVPSNIPQNHPYYNLMRNHELFLHDLRIRTETKDEEIDDLFLSGLG